MSEVAKLGLHKNKLELESSFPGLFPTSKHKLIGDIQDITDDDIKKLSNQVSFDVYKKFDKKPFPLQLTLAGFYTACPDVAAGFTNLNVFGDKPNCIGLTSAVSFKESDFLHGIEYKNLESLGLKCDIKNVELLFKSGNSKWKGHVLDENGQTWIVELIGLPLSEPLTVDEEDEDEKINILRVLSSSLESAIGKQVILEDVKKKNDRIKAVLDNEAGNIMILIWPTSKKATVKSSYIVPMKLAQKVIQAIIQDLKVAKKSSEEIIQAGYIPEVPLTSKELARTVDVLSRKFYRNI